jgi:hypothetical protein
MHTATITLKRAIKKQSSTGRLEVKAECPLCGHTAILVFTGYGSEKEYYCPDRFCPNCKDKQND